MGDEFNINKVDNIICNMQETEISDVGRIIKEMISIKNDNQSLSKKKIKPYDIVEKIELNKISKNIATKIKRYHIDSYDIIDEAINCLSEYEASIRGDLYDYYWDVYMDILIDLKIDSEDCEAITEQVDDIYLSVLNKINKQLFIGKKTDIPYNKIITYIGAITSYVFYKCKFLIPIENMIC